mmetsp:Transcript_22625/g.27990  ORF Transcript_22625/g.27990 Transcript_22625/m.27990 type:complete len:84 (+) Transcript_22625:10-261(+)
MANMMRWFFKEHRGLIINNVILATGFFCFFKFGQASKQYADRFVGLGSWKTFQFLGNSGRSPIYPFKARPYKDEIEERIAYDE